ncbi:penicillin-binding protein 2 [Proteiniclasticum sp. QWL-01]|nr:penicillin-binding protein 2 [Proteiniclasticum sp. QWL-01]WFF73616.1 penicillin-binding protein 2 [Proteiniclasticum sp. QWL-01]
MSLFHRNRKYSSPSVPNQSTAPQDLTPETFVYPGQSAGSADLDSFVYVPDQPAAKQKPASRQGAAKGESTPPADLADLDLEGRYEVDFEAQRRLLHRNIKRVAAVILAMFIGLMSYLGYFQVTRAESLRTDAGNRRNAEARNKVLRGSIFDRSGKVLSRSVLHEDGTQTREYPGGEPYGNILGYVSAKYSVTGLESTMDQILSKQPGVDELLTLDFLSSLLNPEEGVTKKQVGQSLHLTLDSGLQKAAYEAMDGRKGSVVALDPRTGEILAMVSSPGFSAARLDEVMKKVNSDKDYAATAPLINRAVNSVFAPGSTMKTITLAAGLEYLPGLRERVFEDKGYIEFPDGSRLNNFNNNVYGEMNLQSAFTNSSNYIFGSLGIELTNEQLRRTAEALGFNQPIEMQGLKARKSVFPTLGEYAKGDKALTAIGQGAVAATPLQMAMVAAAVANDGQLAAPALISQITDKDGKVVSQAGEPVLTQALSQEVAATVKAMMIQNVKSGGSSYRSLDRNSGAGKTGTAQFEVSDGTRVHAWFIGFAPQKNPRIAFAVVMEDLADVKENTGAQQAIPVVRDLLNYWNSR